LLVCWSKTGAEGNRMQQIIGQARPRLTEKRAASGCFARYEIPGGILQEATLTGKPVHPNGGIVGACLVDREGCHS